MSYIKEELCQVWILRDSFSKEPWDDQVFMTEEEAKRRMDEWILQGQCVQDVSPVAEDRYLLIEEE